VTYRHSLSVIVEVKNTQQLVNFSSAHHFYCYWVRCSSLCSHITLWYTAMIMMTLQQTHGRQCMN